MKLSEYAAQHEQETEQEQIAHDAPYTQEVKADPSLLENLVDPVLSEPIKKDDLAGAYEIILADIRQRRKILKRTARQIQDQARQIDQALQQLDEEENAIYAEKVKAGALDHAVTDTLSIVKIINLLPLEEAIKEIRGLYSRHSGSVAAMGLLYGGIVDLTFRAQREKQLDMLQQYDFIELKKKIAAVIGF